MAVQPCLVPFVRAVIRCKCYIGKAVYALLLRAVGCVILLGGLQCCSSVDILHRAGQSDAAATWHMSCTQSIQGSWAVVVVVVTLHQTRQAL